MHPLLHLVLAISLLLHHNTVPVFVEDKPIIIIVINFPFPITQCVV